MDTNTVGFPTPMLAVADSKYIKGADSLESNCPALHNQTADVALRTYWTTDAHFVCYQVTGTGQPVFPRLNKPILPKLRHLGADVLLHTFAFDWDTPGHVVLTPDLFADFWGKLQLAASRWAIASRWSLMYSTKGGARLVYFLREGVTADKAEAKHRWMVKQFSAVGLDFDKLSDWTRLFRCPRVTREGKPTWESEGWYQEQFHNFLDGDELGESERSAATEYAEIRHFDEPRPTIEDALALHQQISTDTGRQVMSWWYKEARKRLKGRECYPCCFDHQPLAEKGSRDTTLHKFVGQAISMLFRLDGTTPAHIYSLFIAPCQQLEADQQTPDWLTCLWNHIGRLWVREEAKVQAESEKAAVVAGEQMSTLDQIISGMRDWCDHPALKKDAADASAFVKTHLIASTQANHFVMRPDGYYDEMQLSASMLIPRIRALGMDQIIETHTVNQDGGLRELSANQIINKHGTVVASIRGVPNKSGGYIEHMDSSSAVFVVPCFERNPTIEPEFNADVNTWLSELAGRRFVELCEWIAWALAFDEGPICALSLCGAVGAGKKMLVRGLAECLRLPKVATADDLVKDNQYGLLTSPFLHVDEGWPAYGGKGRHPADQFRALVSGQSFDCNRKFMSPVEVNNPVRIILTANNMGVVQMLTANRDLSPEDREALGIRLKHIIVPERAPEWLRMRGGQAFTGKNGARWIAGDSNQPSDYLVAKHFMWLYENREKPVKSLRFLVDGDMDPSLMFEMRTNAGSAPVVIETIIKLLNLNTFRQGIVIQDRRLFVLTQEILEYHREHKKGGMKDLSANTIAAVLKNITAMEHEEMQLRDRPLLSKRRWHELDPDFLLQYARRDGWSCTRLEQLVDERKALGLFNMKNQ